MKREIRFGQSNQKKKAGADGQPLNEAKLMGQNF